MGDGRERESRAQDVAAPIDARPPASVPPAAAGLLGLQKSAGNQAVNRLLSAAPGQAPVVRRTIADDTWSKTVEPNIGPQVLATLEADVGGKPTLLRKKAGALETTTDGTTWTPTTAAAVKSGFTWKKQFRRSKGGKVDRIGFSEPDALTGNVDDTGTVDVYVEGVADDRHSLVHHSFSPYQTPGAGGAKAAPKRREAGHHLTVENAHLLMMHVLKGDKTSAFLDKTKKDKAQVNTDLEGYGNTEVDNLNFFPDKQHQTAKALSVSDASLPTSRLPKRVADSGSDEVDKSLSMAQYLDFIRTSLDSLKGVPAVYGAKLMQTAEAMRARTGLDPTELFLRVGKGDQRHLVRSVCSVALHGLSSDFKLPAKTAATFSKYVLAKPSLPLDETNVETTEWVARGALASDGKTNYQELETKYVTGHYAAIVGALRSYIS